MPKLTDLPRRAGRKALDIVRGPRPSSPVPEPVGPATADAVLIRVDEAATHVLVDLRLELERRAGVIPGALHIPMAELDDRAGEIHTPVVFVCADGGRSISAAMRFREQGRHAWALLGGFVAWQAAGQPTERPA